MMTYATDKNPKIEPLAVIAACDSEWYKGC